MDHASRLGKSLVGMARVLQEYSIPVTIKMRTGAKEGDGQALRLIPRLRREWAVGAVTLHGRSRQQRYSKKADYEVIRSCVREWRATEEEMGGACARSPLEAILNLTSQKERKGSRATALFGERGRLQLSRLPGQLLLLRCAHTLSPF